MTPDMQQFMLHLGVLAGCQHMKHVSGPRVAALAARYHRSLRGLKLRGHIHVVTKRGEPTRYALTHDGLTALTWLSGGLRTDWAPSWFVQLEWNIEE